MHKLVFVIKRYGISQLSVKSRDDLQFYVFVLMLDITVLVTYPLLHINLRPIKKFNLKRTKFI